MKNIATVACQETKLKQLAMSSCAAALRRAEGLEELMKKIQGWSLKQVAHGVELDEI